MDFVKRVRLRHARQKLSTPDVGTSVSAVAFECGFGNPGHFAGDYHHHFGERPSDTFGAAGVVTIKGTSPSVRHEIRYSAEMYARRSAN